MGPACQEQYSGINQRSGDSNARRGVTGRVCLPLGRGREHAQKPRAYPFLITPRASTVHAHWPRRESSPAATGRPDLLASYGNRSRDLHWVSFRWSSEAMREDRRRSALEFVGGGAGTADQWRRRRRRSEQGNKQPGASEGARGQGGTKELDQREANSPETTNRR